MGDIFVDGLSSLVLVSLVLVLVVIVIIIVAVVIATAELAIIATATKLVVVTAAAEWIVVKEGVGAIVFFFVIRYCFHCYWFLLLSVLLRQSVGG